jgi:EmrB/QacA subfamily drug resistance transporter
MAENQRTAPDPSRQEASSAASLASPAFSFWPVMLAIFFGNFMSMLSTTSINLALPVFMTEFDADLLVVQWLMTGSMLATGIIAPIVGFLSDQLTTKRLYLLSLFGFTLTSLLCMFAWNMESLIFFRLLQGVCSGIIIPTTMALIYQVVEKERQAFAISLWSASSMLGPAFGPTIGGWLIDLYGWEALFALNLPLGVFAMIAASRYVPLYRVTSRKSLDVPGFVSVMVCSSALLVACSRGSVWGWTNGKTLALLAMGIVTLLYFIRRALKVNNPVLDLRVFRYPQFTFCFILTSVISISLFSGPLLVPIFLQNAQHASAFDTAIVLLPGTLLMALSTLVIGRLYRKMNPIVPLVAGLVMIAAATWELSHLTLTTTFVFVGGWMALRFVGVGISNLPVTDLAMSAVPKELSGHASALANWARQGIGAFSVALFSSYTTWREIRYAEQLSAGGSPVAQLEELSLTMSINDAFVLAFVVALVALPLSFLLRGKKIK